MVDEKAKAARAPTALRLSNRQSSASMTGAFTNLLISLQISSSPSCRRLPPPPGASCEPQRSDERRPERRWEHATRARRRSEERSEDAQGWRRFCARDLRPPRARGGTTRHASEAEAARRGRLLRWSMAARWLGLVWSPGQYAEWQRSATSFHSPVSRPGAG